MFLRLDPSGADSAPSGPGPSLSDLPPPACPPPVILRAGALILRCLHIPVPSHDSPHAIYAITTWHPLLSPPIAYLTIHFPTHLPIPYPPSHTQAASELDATPEQLQAARAPLAGMVGAAGVVGAGPGGSAAGGPGLGAGVSQGVGKAGGAEALGAGAGAGAGNGLGGFPL